MTSRPTTLVESDQLAQAAAQVIKHEDLVPKGKRWLFARSSKAHRDYDRAVQEITVRRREAREKAVEQKIKRERADTDTVFERAKSAAQTAHDDKIAEARKPFDDTELKARAERDAAMAAAKLAYERAIETANRTYVEQAGAIDEERNAVVAQAKTAHDEAYAELEAKRSADLTQIARELKTIPMEGPMRIVEDRDAWSPDERKKALIGIVDMAGRDDFDTSYADLCLQNVAGYVFQDRYLKPDAQHHRLMDVNLLEALVDLAQRSPEKRPIVVKYMHDIVVNNPGHSSPAFIKSLTELYVAASADAETVYHADPIENEKTFDTVRAHIADTLKLTPRRNQVPLPAAKSVGPRAAAAADAGDDHQTPVMVRDADITADVDVRDLVPIDPAEAQRSDANNSAAPSPRSSTPPLPGRRGKRTSIPEGSA